MPFLAPIQDQLKQIIDTGYSRNTTVAAAAPPALTNSPVSPVVAQAAKTSPTEALATPQAPLVSVADVPAEAQIQTNQTSTVVPPKTAKQSVTPADEPPTNVSDSTTGETVPVPAAVSQPQTPTADPVRDTTTTTTTTTTTNTNTNTVNETQRDPTSASHDRRIGADAANSPGDSAAVDAGTAPKHPATAGGDKPNPHNAAESEHDGSHSAADSDHEE
jgi:hypothetical protein